MLMKRALRVDKTIQMCLCVILSDVVHKQALILSDEINGFLARCEQKNTNVYSETTSQSQLLHHAACEFDDKKGSQLCSSVEKKTSSKDHNMPSADIHKILILRVKTLQSVCDTILDLYRRRFHH